MTSTAAALLINTLTMLVLSASVFVQMWTSRKAAKLSDTRQLAALRFSLYQDIIMSTGNVLAWLVELGSLSASEVLEREESGAGTDFVRRELGSAEHLTERVVLLASVDVKLGFMRFERCLVELHLRLSDCADTAGDVPGYVSHAVEEARRQRSELSAAIRSELASAGYCYR